MPPSGGCPIETVSEPKSVAVSTIRVRPASALSVLYLAVTAVPLAAGGVGGSRAFALVAHVGALALILAAELARGSDPAPAWARLVSDLHVLVLLPALYAELPLLMDGMPGDVVYRDPAVQSLEMAVLGFQPAWELAARWPIGWLSELLHLAYLLYYPIIYVPPLLLLSARPRGRGSTDLQAAQPNVQILESEFAFERAVLALSLSMLSCYLVFVLWPVQGPRYIAPPVGVPEGPVRGLVLTILQGGSSRGAAFPSSHVAVAVTQSLVMLRYRPRLGVVFTAVSALLALGAVYGGFHYAVDAFFGAAFGAFAWFASGPVQRLFQPGPKGFAPARSPV